MTNEEIKKIAEDYGEYESKTPKHAYIPWGNPTCQQKERAKEYARQAMLMLNWLTKNFCIVSKSEVKAYYANSKDNLEHSKHDYRCLFEQGEIQAIETLFGIDTFDEEV